jgi:threonine synthase
VSFTYSPAMDIQVASNFERYLYYQLGEDPKKVSAFMKSFLESGEATLNFNTARFDETFLAGAADNAETLATIRETWESANYLVDPHTAVGIAVGKRMRDEAVPLMCLATAHPAKFESALAEALPSVEVSHPSLAALADLPVRKTVLDADVEIVKHFIEAGGRTG